jgi:hypothetical protein
MSDRARAGDRAAWGQPTAESLTDQEQLVAGRHTDPATGLALGPDAERTVEPDGAGFDRVGLDGVGFDGAGFDGAGPTVDYGDVDLADDPFDDDLAERLRSRTPLRVTRVTVGLAAAALVVVGFLGGVLVQKNVGATAPAAAALPTGFAGRFGGGNPNGGGGGTGTGQGTPRAGTTGTVKLVDGTTLYITTAAGDVLIVKTSPTTAVRSEQSVALKDLKVGASVTVVGATAGDGSITATQVTATR